MKKREKKPYLTYALDKNGALVHVDDVPNGKNCECICPHCKSELIAKNEGEHKIHHFAHSNGADCSGAIESALHIMAKEVLLKTKSIYLPPIPNVCAARLLYFDKVVLETQDKDLNLRPDCIGYYGDKFVWIEFKRTHAVDKKKKGKIVSARIDCIEVDINECELNPDVIRTFLINQVNNRIWIYNSELQDSGKTDSQKNNNRNLYENEYYCEYQKVQFDRTFAVDENGRIVNSYYLEEINMNEHSYFCLACGKELCLDVDSNGKYFFVHVSENKDCSDDSYLIETAKSILYNRFQTCDRFDIMLNQPHVCNRRTICNLYDENECCIMSPRSYDLKSQKYDCCEKDVTLQGSSSKAHLLISHRNNRENSIIINIKTLGSSEGAVSKLRTIDVTVNDEDDLFKLQKNAIGSNGLCSFQNFRTKQKYDIDRENVKRRLSKFTLFKSGKSFVKVVNCQELSTYNVNNTAVEELLFSVDMYYNTALFNGLLYCYGNKKKACYCNICAYSRDTDYDLICIRYKTKGTPHYPLNSPELPINCQYFRLNKELSTEEDDSVPFVVLKTTEDFE